MFDGAGGEVIDIVDEDDNVIGKSERVKAHDKGLIHRSVIFFIINRKGNIFVTQRSSDRRFYPNYWSICMGGHVSSGEDPENTVVREIKEETGLDTKPEFICSCKRRFGDNDNENMWVYAAVTSEQPDLDKEEVVQGSFMSTDEVEEIIQKKKFVPETAMLFEILKEKILKF